MGDNNNNNNYRFADAVPSHCGVSTSSENDSEADGGDDSSASIFWAAQTTMVNDYMTKPTAPVVPHRGKLRRVHVAAAATPTAPLSRQQSSSASVTSSKSSATAMSSYTSSAAPSFVYALTIAAPSFSSSFPFDPTPLPDGRTPQVLELQYDRHEYDMLVRLFSILDSESKGSVGRDPVREFVRFRCPVFRRRDRALRKFGRPIDQEEKDMVFSASRCDDAADKDTEDTPASRSSATFDEAWDSVMECSTQPIPPGAQVELGLEGWMIFCRLIALAQYQEAKRRFSVRHSQQTMRHKSGGTEVVLVDVPPPDPPEPLTARELADHEAASTTPLALPELDLDHCLLSAHDVNVEKALRRGKRARVEVKVFGSGRSGGSLLGSASPASPGRANSADLDFVVTYYPAGSESGSSVVVRRSFGDMAWLCDTFALHKSPGGTLCGRILPPFPSRLVGRSSTSSDSDGAHTFITGSVVAAGGSAAIAAASAGVGMIASVAKSAKSLLGGYVASSGKNSTSTRTASSKITGSNLGGWSYGRDNSSESSLDKAKQIERYLNYLLEHPALCTSFPLNVILKSSQSGLDSAKRILEDHAKHHDRQRRQQQEVTQTDEEKAVAYLSPSLLSRLPSADSMYSYQPNLSWVRSAAQAAVALKLHGILETTGMPSASAKLQHASLPEFDNGKQQHGEEDSNDRSPRSTEGEQKRVSTSSASAGYFESGVVAVASGLETNTCDDADDEGYDMLPSPVPPPEKGVLCAGSTDQGAAANDTKVDTNARYDYGSQIVQGEASNAGDNAAVLGDLSVDRDIDKLREVIGSVDNMLNRCLAAGARIGKARQKENGLHVSILRGMDSWQGLRGELVSQRALLNGVSVLEGGNDLSEQSYASLKNDLSWQTSLASSAVTAAEDVRSAVRASKTAARAKLAAEAASKSAQKACETGVFATPDEGRAAQTKASIAHSHAIHSAVIEHEALAAKRRAAMALAHDVKCWNVHRKREMLALCRNLARDQREAAHQSIVAWNHLREGFIGSSPVSVMDVQDERPSVASGANAGIGRKVPEVLSFSLNSSIDTFGLGSSIGHDLPASDTNTSQDLLGLGSSIERGFSPSYTNTSAIATEVVPSASTSSFRNNNVVSVENSETKKEEERDLQQQEQEHGLSILERGSVTMHANAKKDLAFEAPEEGRLVDLDSSNEESSVALKNEPGAENPENEVTDSVTEERSEPGEASEIMTGSMQSLVDGLMNWGGQYDSQEDMSLPSGMAVSMMLEESGVVGKNWDGGGSAGRGIIDPDIL